MQPSISSVQATLSLIEIVADPSRVLSIASFSAGQHGVEAPRTNPLWC